jgi:hypothetical protein
LHFLSTLSLNNARTSFLTGSDSGGTIITFFWASIFSFVYLTNITPFDDELTKSTIAPFDGELARSTIAAFPSFLAGLPLLTRFNGELAKSTMATLAFFLAGLPLLTALDGELGKSTMEVFSVGMGSWFCSTFSCGWFSMGGWFCSKFCSGGGWFYSIVGLDFITVASIPFTQLSSSFKCLIWHARASRSIRGHIPLLQRKKLLQ